jgi:hypothetical protein
MLCGRVCRLIFGARDRPTDRTKRGNAEMRRAVYTRSGEALYEDFDSLSAASAWATSVVWAHKFSQIVVEEKSDDRWVLMAIHRKLVSVDH